MHTHLIGKIFDLGRVLQQFRFENEEECESPLFLALRDEGNDQIWLLPVTMTVDAGSHDVRVPSKGLTNPANPPQTIHCAFRLLCPAAVLEASGDTGLQLHPFHLRRALERVQQSQSNAVQPNPLDARVDVDPDYQEQITYMNAIVWGLSSYFDALAS